MSRPDFKRKDWVRVTSQFREVPAGAIGQVALVQEVTFNYHKNEKGWIAEVEIEGRTYEIEVEYLEKADAVTRLGNIET